MSDVTPGNAPSGATSATGAAPSAGFIGWGPESQAMLDVLRARFPDIGTQAALLAGSATDHPLERPAPTMESLFSTCNLIFAEGGMAFLEPHLATIRLAISDRHVLALLGGGWSMDDLLEVLKERNLVRCMLLPAQPEGTSHLAFLVSPHFSSGELAGFRDLFSHLKMRVELKAEAQFEVIRGLADFAPVALYTIIDAMADGVVMMGFPRAAALEYLASLLHAAALRMLEADTTPALLREQALTVDVAAAGLIELESAGIRGTMMRAIHRAVEHRGVAKLSNKDSTRNDDE